MKGAGYPQLRTRASTATTGATPVPKVDQLARRRACRDPVSIPGNVIRLFRGTDGKSSLVRLGPLLGLFAPQNTENLLRDVQPPVLYLAGFDLTAQLFKP